MDEPLADRLLGEPGDGNASDRDAQEELRGTHAALTQHPEGSYRELFAVALPLMVSTGSHSVMIFCDRLFLTSVGKTELGAALSGGMAAWSAIAIPLGTLGYASTFVSQYFGAGDDLRARAAVWQSFWLGLIAGLLLLLTIPAAPHLFALADHKPELQQKETLYFSILMLAALPRLLIGAFFCHFSGRGETRIPMVAAVIGNAANICLSYWFVFGGLGLEAKGLAGAASGTVAATLLELVFYLGFVGLARRETLPQWWASRSFDWGMSKRLLRFGTPAGIQMFSDALAFTVALTLVGRIGEDELAATTIALSTNAIVFVPLIGLGMAVSTIVGHRVGAGRARDATASVSRAVQFGLLMMGTFAFCCVFLPDFVIGPYDRFGGTEFASFRPLLVRLLRFLAAFALFDALAVLFGFAIRGAGDTTFSLIVLTATGWGLLVVPLLLLTHYEQLTLDRCWLILTGTIAVQGLVFAARYFGGRWQSMTVMSR